MAKVELIMPKMGESIMEATILNWVKNVGDKLEEDETILEIATDKVDSEIPSPVDGILVEILKQVNDVVPVGEVIAILETEGEAQASPSVPQQAEAPAPVAQEAAPPAPPAPVEVEQAPTPPTQSPAPQVAEVAAAAPAVPYVPATSSNGNGAAIPTNNNGKFYSPLVRSCLLYTSPSPRDATLSRMPSSA